MAEKQETATKSKEEPEVTRDDDWDDSALISAYDKAMTRARVEVAKKKGILYVPGKNDQKSKKKQKMNKFLQWCIGDYCQAVYSEDGKPYESVIRAIDERSETCTVEFLGYGNEEEVLLSSLSPSLGRSSRQRQDILANSLEENGECDDAESSSFSEEESSRRKRIEPPKTAVVDDEAQKEPIPYHRCYASRHAHHYNMAPITQPPPPPPMPAPPPFLLDRAGAEDDKLYSMLLSWYMSGYHTGFYMGSRQSQPSATQHRNMYHNYCSH